MAPAAFWASLADAVPMISERLPEVANCATDQLANGQNLDGCLREVATSSEQLDRHGFVDPVGQVYNVEPVHPLQFQWRRVATWLATRPVVRRPSSFAIASTNGAALQSARHLKEIEYSELLVGDRCCLVVIGVETGGRSARRLTSSSMRLHRLSAIVATFSTLGLATPVDTDVRSLLHWSRARATCGLARRRERDKPQFCSILH